MSGYKKKTVFSSEGKFFPLFFPQDFFSPLTAEAEDFFKARAVSGCARLLETMCLFRD